MYLACTALGHITWWMVYPKIRVVRAALAPQKIEGPSGEKNALKSRNNCNMNGQDCGYIGIFDSRPKFAQS